MRARIITSLTCALTLSVATTFGQPGAIDLSFDPGLGVDGSVRDIALQPDGKILIAGWFDNYNGVLQRNLARINTDGSLDTGFDSQLQANQLDRIALQADGKILCAGPDGDGIARLTSDGSVDTGFDAGSGINQDIFAITIQPDGKILIGGYFSTYDGVARNRIARLNSDGSLDTSFDPGAGATGTSAMVASIALQPDGKILIGGGFTEYDGIARSRIARLNSDGSLDPSFDPGTGAEDYVGDMALLADGRVMIVGYFNAYNGTARNRIARINVDGSLDTSFDPGAGPNYDIYAMALQPDGRVVLGGLFTEWVGTDQNFIARINADGGLDQTFDSGEGVYDYLSKVYSLALQPDGRIVLGGLFDGYDGTPRTNIARILGGSIVGIGEAAPLAGLRVAPNPVINSLHLAGLQGSYQWTITDVMGRVLLQGAVGNSATPTIDVSALPHGGYLLNVNDGNARITRPFVKA